LKPDATLRADVRTIGLVGVAHLTSHFFQLVIPPMFPVLKDEFALGYTELGLVMTLFFVISAGMQTIAGAMADRFGGGRVLLGGVALLSLGILLAGFASSYSLLLVAALVAGLGNSVFHPADFAILNARVDRSHLGHAFSVHNIGGHLGWALAPVYALATLAFGWRNALIGAGLLGFGIFALLFWQRDALRTESRRVPAASAAPAAGLRVLLSPAVLLYFLFFVLLSVSMVGTQNYLIPVLHALYGMPALLAGSALTAYLLGSAAGTFTGGFVATRTTQPERVTAAGVLAMALFYFLLASGWLPPAAIVAMAALGGFSLGIILPSRDLLVRDAAPAESRGKVYGLVYSGLDVGAAIAPVLLGWQLDHGQHAGVLVVIGVLLLLAIATIFQARRLTR
jgi:MFS family permease